MLVAVPELGLNAPAVQALRDVGEHERRRVQPGNLETGEKARRLRGPHRVGGIVADDTPDDALGILRARDKFCRAADLHALTRGALGDDDILIDGNLLLDREAHVRIARALLRKDEVLGDIGAGRIGNAGDIYAVGVPVHLHIRGERAGIGHAVDDGQAAGIELNPAHLFPHGIGSDIFSEGGRSRQRKRQAKRQNNGKKDSVSRVFHLYQSPY